MSAPYPVLVIGAGVAGLAVAILLKIAGHDITVLERRADNYVSNSTGGISLTENATRIIAGVMGLQKELSDIADSSTTTFVKKYKSGEILRTIKKNQNCLSSGITIASKAFHITTC